MNGRKLAGPVIALLVAVSVYALWPRVKLSPEDEIKALVAKVIASAEKRDAPGVTAALADTFHGGGLGKQELNQLVFGQFFQARQIVVLNPRLEVFVSSPTEGSFKGTFLFARDGAAPDASSYTIEAEVQKTGKAWQITTASWTH